MESGSGCQEDGDSSERNDPRKVNLEGLMQRYRGTPVIEESLEKLFHERMDIEGTQDSFRQISNGSVEVHITAPGRLGRSPKADGLVASSLERCRD